MTLILVFTVAIYAAEISKASFQSAPINRNNFQSYQPSSCVADDGLSARAARAAELAIPGPLNFQTGQLRRGYIGHHIPELFDPDKTGYLDYKRYADFHWSLIKVAVPDIECTMNFEQFMLWYNGPQDILQGKLKANPGLYAFWKPIFDKMAGPKGYITRDEYGELYSKTPFYSQFEVNRNGKAPIALFSQEAMTGGR